MGKTSSEKLHENRKSTITKYSSGDHYRISFISGFSENSGILLL